jgi:hypothetical protein
MQIFVHIVESNFEGGKKMALINCPECGIELNGNSDFCSNCGKRLETHQKKTFKPIIGAILLIIASFLLLEVVAVQFFDWGTLNLGIVLEDWFPVLFKLGLFVLGLLGASESFRRNNFRVALLGASAVFIGGCLTSFSYTSDYTIGIISYFWITCLISAISCIILIAISKKEFILQHSWKQYKTKNR